MSPAEHVEPASRRAQRDAGGGSASGASERSERPRYFTNNSSPAGGSVVGGEAEPRCRHWFALRDRTRSKVDRSDPRQVQAARDESRAERWTLRRLWREHTRSKRVRSCGRPGARPDGSVVLTMTPGQGEQSAVAGYSGLFSCGSVWLCTTCSSRIAAERAQELQRVIAHYVSRGGYVVLVTLTMRHYAGHSLADCMAAFTRAWQRVTSGRACQDERELTDFAGYCRALEVTESPDNGWHVHPHVVLVFNSRPSDDALDAMTGGMFARWSAALVKAGLPAPTMEHGLDVQRLPEGPDSDVAETVTAWSEYVAKGLSAETVLGTAKAAKGRNRTIRDLMRAALLPTRYEDPSTGTIVETLDETALARLQEYERVMTGRKQLTWSQKAYDLRAAVGLAEEKTDEEIVDEELGGEDVAILPRETWKVVEPRATELLAVTERQGAAGAHRWLDELGVQWWRPTGLTRHLSGSERPPGGSDG